LSPTGDSEDDTIIVFGIQSDLLAMVERKALYPAMAQLDGKGTEPLTTDLINRMKKDNS
jgi:IS30 family transposase